MNEFKSIRDLLDTLRNDNELKKEDKLKMVTNFRVQLGDKMATHNQSSDQMIENNEKLQELNKEVEFYSV